MTQKDYIKIAAVLNQHTPRIVGQDLTLDALIIDLIGMFQDDNPSFDQSKFLAASYKERRSN